MNIIDFSQHTNNFTWDYKLHFPVPTLNYIKARTGEDVAVLFDTAKEAEGRVLAVVRSAKNYLFEKRIDTKAWEWHIAHNEKLLYEVLEYLLEVINFAFITGDYAELLRVLDGKETSVALDNARGAVLGARKTIPYGAPIREGY